MIITLIILSIIFISSFIVEWKTFEHALRGRYARLNWLAALSCTVSGLLIIVVGLVIIYTALG